MNRLFVFFVRYVLTPLKMIQEDLEKWVVRNISFKIRSGKIKGTGTMLDLLHLYFDFGGILSQFEFTHLIRTYPGLLLDSNIRSKFAASNPATGNLFDLYSKPELRDPMFEIICEQLAKGHVKLITILPILLHDVSLAPEHRDRLLHIYLDHSDPYEHFHGWHLLQEKYPQVIAARLEEMARQRAN